MCMKQYTLKTMRIGQSRVIYSGAEEPLGVVCIDDIHTQIYIHTQPNSIIAQRLSYLVVVIISTTATVRTSNMMQSKGQETDQCPTHVYSINIENVR